MCYGFNIYRTIVLQAIKLLWRHLHKWLFCLLFHDPGQLIKYPKGVLEMSLSFCWSGHVFTSLWSNVSKVKSLKHCSLKVFSRCNCHCHCHCLCLCICLCRCVFVGQVIFLHDPHQFCKISVWSERPEGFESITANMHNNDKGRHGAVRAAKNDARRFLNFLWFWFCY